MTPLHCEFKDLDDALLDWLVCGVRDLRLQHRLLANPDLSFQSTLDEARAAELVVKTLVAIQQNHSLSTADKYVTSSMSSVHQGDRSEESEYEEDGDINCLNKVTRKSWPSSKGMPKSACMGCGVNHIRADCRFRQALCLKGTLPEYATPLSR